MRSVGLAVIGVAVLVVLVTTGVATGFAVREARGEIAASVREVFATNAPAARPGLQSVKRYDAGGKLVQEWTAPAERVPLRGLAARFVAPEVSCKSAGGGTLCVETTPVPLARRLRGIFAAGGIGLLAATLLGTLAAVLVARQIGRPLHRIAGVVDRAARERAYSMRAEAAPGDLGRLATSVNELLAQIQDRDVAIRRRTLELEAANKELESFAYSVSHDLRAPLGSIDGFVQALDLDYRHLYDENAKEYIGWIREACRQMRDLIDGLLQMSRISRAELERTPVDLSAIARSVADSLRQSNPGRPVRFEIREGLRTIGDERLLRAVLENLMTNAWKFTRNRDEARIEFGVRDGAYYVRDNGAGFDPTHAAKMFRPFQRLHSSREFEGTGIGLATVQKIIERHGGRAWAEGEVEKGATIYFTTATESAA